MLEILIASRADEAIQGKSMCDWRVVQRAVESAARAVERSTGRKVTKEMIRAVRLSLENKYDL